MHFYVFKKVAASAYSDVETDSKNFYDTTGGREAILQKINIAFRVYRRKV